MLSNASIEEIYRKIIGDHVNDIKKNQPSVELERSM